MERNRESKIQAIVLKQYLYMDQGEIEKIVLGYLETNYYDKTDEEVNVEFENLN